MHLVGKLWENVWNRKYFVFESLCFQPFWSKSNCQVSWRWTPMANPCKFPPWRSRRRGSRGGRRSSSLSTTSRRPERKEKKERMQETRWKGDQWDGRDWRGWAIFMSGARGKTPNCDIKEAWRRYAVQWKAVTVTPSEIGISQEPWQVSQNCFGSPISIEGYLRLLATSCQILKT